MYRLRRVVRDFSRRLTRAFWTKPGKGGMNTLGFGTGAAITSGLIGMRMHCISDDTANGTAPRLPALNYSKPRFSPDDAAVVFVIGGPGAGKGTQCSLLADMYGARVQHLSAGDLLREERARPGSIYGDLINTFITEGRIVPFEITISLLQKAMECRKAECYLIDGFPRAIDQGEAFERAICQSSALIFFDCPEEVLTERLLARGKSSGRTDDNIASIHKRFVTFKNATVPVLEHYQKKVPVFVIDSSTSPREILLESSAAVEGVLDKRQKRGNTLLN